MASSVHQEYLLEGITTSHGHCGGWPQVLNELSVVKQQHKQQWQKKQKQKKKIHIQCKKCQVHIQHISSVFSNLHGIWELKIPTQMVPINITTLDIVPHDVTNLTLEDWQHAAQSKESWFQ